MPKTIEDRKYSWKSLAEIWKDLKPPLRPSTQEIKIYEKFLKRIIKKIGKKPKILLFGATPELRDLFTKYRLEVSMVDINREMVQAMNKLVKSKNPKEKIFYGDWLNFQLPEKFDAVIGDHIYCNIPFKKHREFSVKIKNHLNQNGYLITNMVLREIREKVDLKSFLKQYRRGFKNRFEKWYSLHALMFNTDLYQEKEHGPYWLSVLELVRQARKQNVEITLEEAGEITDHIYMPKSCIYILPRRKEFEQVLKKDFKILDSETSKEHRLYKCYRIYFAQKI